MFWHICKLSLHLKYTKAMSKTTFIKRYLWLFDLIKNKQCISYKEIADQFSNSDLKYDHNAGFSKRTFHRDVQEMSDIFGIDINFDKSRNGYFIEIEDITPNTNLLLELYRYINLFKVYKETDRYVAAEQERSGNEHLLLLLSAIQNRRKIEFVYCKFTDEVPQTKTAEPYFVKEYKNRWYVIARDTGDLQVKTFALERIVSDIKLISASASFDTPRDVKPKTYFKDSFGIFKLTGSKCEEIELSFKPLKGKFIKSQPLHSSQKIIVDSVKELRIILSIQITHDFIMELLSHGSEVKVIAPESLKIRLIEEYKKSLNQYK